MLEWPVAPAYAQLEVTPLVRGEPGLMMGLDLTEDLPFRVRRIIYATVKNAEHGPWGRQALDADLFILCLGGECQVSTEDREERKNLWLLQPGLAVFVPAGTWYRVENWKYRCILCVLSGADADTKVWQDHHVWREEVVWQQPQTSP